jgi:2-polyprenyl-6-hydroxyphenyl methylase/3-demethylubiquinone-9 3-methyltransferase
MHDRILKAVQEVEAIVKLSGLEGDIQYFNFHKNRFIRMAETVEAKSGGKGRVLDIGSHYLHSSLILKRMGYEVQSMDVAAFWNLDFVQQRALENGLLPIVENNLETLSGLEGKADVYDIIVFAEIFEHITFNPIRFWKHIYRLIKSGGFIYISTPNSLTLYNLFRQLKNIFLLKGIGLSVEMIFKNVTYGHHWKEYSVAEIREYFAALSPDFAVTIHNYHYKMYPANTFVQKLRRGLVGFSNLFPFFKEDMEAVVEVKKSGAWNLTEPEF